ncbi:hypothetical protein LC724_19455 [Blautia sp. RD014234]|nr:hypothetical protein [Blautia parvula]
MKEYTTLQTCSYPAALPDGGTVNLTVETGDHSIFPVSFSAGILPTGENEIALSSLNAEELKLSVGDTLDLNVNGKSQATPSAVFIPILRTAAKRRKFVTDLILLP